MNTQKHNTRLPLWFIRSLLLGLVGGAITILVILLASAAIATAYDVPSAIVVPLAMVANAIGAVTAGFVCARVNGRNGWLMGLLCSLLLFAFSTAAGFGFFSESDGSFLLTKALIMSACGTVGGIFAVNTAKRRKKR